MRYIATLPSPTLIVQIGWQRDLIGGGSADGQTAGGLGVSGALGGAVGGDKGSWLCKLGSKCRERSA